MYLYLFAPKFKFSVLLIYAQGCTNRAKLPKMHFIVAVRGQRAKKIYYNNQLK